MDLCWSNHVVQGLTVHTHIHISYVIYISYHFVCVCVKWEIKRNIYQTTSSGFLGHGIIRDFISHIHLFFLFIYVFGCARSSLWHLGSFTVACKLLVAACGIQFPEQGSNSTLCTGSVEFLSHWTTKQVPIFFFFKKIYLFYWSIIDLQCEFLLYSNVIQLHTHTHIHTHIYILFHILFPYGLSQAIKYTVLYSKTLLFIHYIYNSLHLLIPNSLPSQSLFFVFFFTSLCSR